ncbi:MAG: hypothetical protein ACI9WL_000199 [Rubritalea sp.]|mgnify:CR=1 FL=1|jgi:hypothetical protein
MKIKYQYCIIVAALGIVFNTIGALVKILHWEFYLGTIKVNGPMLLIIGTIFLIIAAFLLLIKVVFVTGNNSLNK